MLFPRAAPLPDVRWLSPLLAGCLGAAFAVFGPAFAEDPPSRVGSLNYLSGEVTYNLRDQPGDPGQSDAADNWLRADFNQPVCQDMSLKTGANARARVRIGPDAIQMSDNTWLNLLNLSYDQIEASLTQGRIYLQLSKLDPGENVELETPRGSVWVLQAGAYDIDIGDRDQPTRIIVFEGKARFVGGSADLPIGAGKQALVSGTYPSLASTESDWSGINPTQAAASAQPVSAGSPNPATASLAGALAPPSPRSPETSSASMAEQSNIAAAGPVPSAADHPFPNPAEGAVQPPSRDFSVPAPLDARQATVAGAQAAPSKSTSAAASSDQKPSDPFLSWVVEESDQDQGPQAAQRSTQYVSAETTGADALDRYGQWQKLPDSEPVWFPSAVPNDWAPYRFGHWDWIAPWGWTWIDDQPWGFAPFHYGRWVNIDGRWGWVPGTAEPQPVYAPALVAFVDTAETPNGGPVGGPGVGWFPLGPSDDYSPWYAAGPKYIVAVNAPEHWQPHDLGVRGYGGRDHEAWRGQYFNRRYATVVPREAFAGERRIDRGMVRQLDASRLDHMSLLHGAPHIAPVAMRSVPGPGEFRGGFRGMTPAAAAAGGLHARPGGGPTFEHGPGMVGRGAPENAGRFERGGRPPAGLVRPSAGHFGGTQYGRPQGFQGATAGYHGNPQQFVRPQGFQGAAAGYRGYPQQFGRPQIPQGFRGTQPFGRPQMAQAFHGGSQFGRPQLFQTPAAFRGGGMMGRVASPLAAHPALSAGGVGGRHK